VLILAGESELPDGARTQGTYSSCLIDVLVIPVAPTESCFGTQPAAHGHGIWSRCLAGGDEAEVDEMTPAAD
jgi:hypothetical protein